MTFSFESQGNVYRVSTQVGNNAATRVIVEQSDREAADQSQQPATEQGEAA